MAKTQDDGVGVQEHFPVPNIRHLRIVEATARHESLSRAALEIGLSQPAVSQAIAKIEAGVGQPLFDRAQNGSYLTPAGEVFVHRIRRYLGQIDEAIAHTEGRNNGRGRARHITGAQIRCLLAISVSTSFSQAARSIGISIASLHRAARELETNVSTALYRSSKDGLQVSEDGAELARRLRLAMREIEAASDDIHYLDGVESGKVTIGTLPMSGAYLIGATIARLTQMMPEARVYVTNAPFDVQLNNLRSGAVDLIFGVLRRPDWATDLKEEALFLDPYCIIARPDHPLAGRPEISIEQLREAEWIVPKAGSPRYRQFDALFRELGTPPRISIEASSLTTILSILSCSDRLALVSKHEVDTADTLKLVSILKSPVRFEPLAKGLTTRVDWLPTPIQSRFLNMLRTEARRMLSEP